MCRKLSTKLCPNRNLVRAMHPLTAPPYFIHVSSMFHFLKIANQRLSVRREQHRPDHAPTISFFTIAISTPYPDSLVKGPLHAPSLPSSIRSQSPHPTPPPNHQSHQPPLILQTQTALPPRNRPLHYQPPLSSIPASFPPSTTPPIRAHPAPPTPSCSRHPYPLRNPSVSHLTKTYYTGIIQSYLSHTLNSTIPLAGAPLLPKENPDSATLKHESIRNRRPHFPALSRRIV